MTTSSEQIPDTQRKMRMTPLRPIERNGLKGFGFSIHFDEAAKADESWFALMLRASETGLIPEAELLDARRTMSADQYAQEFECSFEAAIQGAYYAQAISEARQAGRIGNVARDPLMQVRAFWDIGVRDATAIWIAQFIGKEVRVLDYYEASGQPLAVHLNWLREKSYGNALCVLPHDGSNPDTVMAVRYEDHIRSAGFEVETVKNQGKAAAMQRIEAGRRLFPSIWFNEATTKPGIEALAAYHEKRDEKRNVGLGPNHDWSSHGADAFGLMCVAYEAPIERKRERIPALGAGGWMA